MREGRNIFLKNYTDTERPAHSPMDTWKHSSLRTTWFRRADHEWLITWTEQSGLCLSGNFLTGQMGTECLLANIFSLITNYTRERGFMARVLEM